MKIKSINGMTVYNIDDVPTIILKIKGNIAKCKILRKDLTFDDCYVAKGNNMFAHGKTIKEAVISLQGKIINSLDVDERIEEFKKMFNKTDKYSASEFYEWHYMLTGSCELGRKKFIEEHDIKLTDTFTVKEFIKICENSYANEIIKKLKEFY